MYQADELTIYPFFREILESTKLSVVLDSLTGLVSRPYILRFIQHLIACRTPFTLEIIDLDNFKSINDNYGHVLGDAVLARTADDLRAYLGADGLVGRFGGDEFLVINFNCVDYDAVHGFCDRMHRTLFRRNVVLNGVRLYLTATTGSASYPQDAQDYDTLFAQVDKTLYRGKTKGRNCYIIFVREKHQNLDITKLTHRSLYDTFRQMAEGFDAGSDLRDRMSRGFAPLRRILHWSGLMYVNGAGEATNLETGAAVGRVESIGPLVDQGLYAPSHFDEIRGAAPLLFGLLDGLGLGSALFHRVGAPEENLGYLIFCPELHTMHIWQDEECAVAYVYSRMVARYLRRRAEQKNNA